MNPEVFDEIWQRFITGDHISQGSIWGGEGLALVVPVESPEVVSMIEHIQRRLAAQLPFYAHLPETLHITIDLFGNPPAEIVSNLSAFLQEAFAPVRAFSVTLTRINSFFRAPFLEVDDVGVLNSLHSCIRPALTRMGLPEIDYGPRGQVWHVTLGAYMVSNDGSIARQLLNELRHICVGTFLVNELRLVKTSAGAPYRMEMLERFSLRDPKVAIREGGRE